MADRWVARTGQLGLLIGVLGVRRALLLNSSPERGLLGKAGKETFYRVCQNTICTVNLFDSDSSESKECYCGQGTLAIAVVGQGREQPAKSTSLYIYACLPCWSPPVRLPQQGSPVCNKHHPPLAMTLLASP
ncbi:hypothetical protein [Streptomyces prunicolor]|uniref:hypothetical protein n=1 Tax=Streptomyces prunicolor TaxID=67348 RepID=UPI00341AAE13